MVGPDSVASPSGGDGLRLRPTDDNDDDDDDCDTTTPDTTTSPDEPEVDIVQLLTRRLSVTPPTDLYPAIALGCGRQLTASSYAEVSIRQR